MVTTCAVKNANPSRLRPPAPSRLRLMGKNYNTQFNYMARALLYEGLLTQDPVTLEWLPALALLLWALHRHWPRRQQATVPAT